MQVMTSLSESRPSERRTDHEHAHEAQRAQRCEQAHEAIRRAKQNGIRCYGEPLIQHLTLDDSEYRHPDWDHAARRVMSPPFRDKKHQDSLWAGLQAGTLQVVATDHCAFSTEQKRYGVGDFTKIPNGTGGLEDRIAPQLSCGLRVEV